MARILKLQGFSADISGLSAIRSICRRRLHFRSKICENYGVKFVRNLPDGEYTTIVDAIFGSGLSREIRGNYREVIEDINRHPAKIFAVDIPSGISSDDGRIQGTAVRADVTGALAFRKLGHAFILERSMQERPFCWISASRRRIPPAAAASTGSRKRASFPASNKRSGRKQRKLR